MHDEHHMKVRISMDKRIYFALDINKVYNQFDARRPNLYSAIQMNQPNPQQPFQTNQTPPATFNDKNKPSDINQNNTNTANINATFPPKVTETENHKQNETRPPHSTPKLTVLADSIPTARDPQINGEIDDQDTAEGKPTVVTKQVTGDVSNISLANTSSPSVYDIPPLPPSKPTGLVGEVDLKCAPLSTSTSLEAEIISSFKFQHVFIILIPNTEYGCTYE